MVSEIVAGAVIASVALTSGLVGRLTGRRRGRACAGYQKRRDGDFRTDCRAVRSVLCVDGRCSYHCRDMCRCDPTVETTGRE